MFISYTREAEVRDQGASQRGPGGADDHLAAVCSPGGERPPVSSSSYKGAEPTLGGPLSRCRHTLSPPKGFTSRHHTGDWGFDV